MSPKFKLGQVVRTKKGSPFQVEGPIRKIITPNSDLQLLWGNDDLHYLVRDNQTGEYVSVIEKGLERR